MGLDVFDVSQAQSSKDPVTEFLIKGLETCYYSILDLQ